MAGGLYGMNRLPRDSVRARRNATQLASNFTSLLGDGLVVGGAGLIAIDLAADPGLAFSGGDLTAKVAAPLALDATGIHLDYTTGLTLDGTNLVVDNTVFIPYNGATADIDLGTFGVTTTGLIVAGNLDVDTLNLNGNIISDSTGAISFSNENLTTTGTINFGGGTSTEDLVLNKNLDPSPRIHFIGGVGGTHSYIGIDAVTGYLTLTSSEGVIDFDNDQILTTGTAAIGNISINTNIITSSTGTIDFNSDNLTTTSTITGEQITSTDDMTMAGILTNTLAATDEDGIFVDGFTNDYTGASHGYAGRFMRDYDFGTGTLSEFKTLYVEANHKSSDAKMTASKSIASIKSNMILGGKFTQNQTTGKNFYDKAFFLTVDDNAVYDTSSTGPFYINHRAGEFTIDNDATYTDSGGSNPYTRVINVGGFFQVNASPTLISGSVTVLNRGVMIDVTGTIVGSQTNVGMYIDRVSGADTNWGIWDASGANWALDGDNQKILWGEGQDASIQYDGTDLLINSHEVGSGHIVLDSPKTTTGDPAGVEGKVYWNTMDNVIRMYADGAWRTLASW